MKNNRWIPITWGIIYYFIAASLIGIFGLNVITVIIGIILFALGSSSMQTGMFGSKRLIEEITSSSPSEPLTSESKFEYDEIHSSTSDLHQKNFISPKLKTNKKNSGLSDKDLIDQLHSKYFEQLWNSFSVLGLSRKEYCNWFDKTIVNCIQQSKQDGNFNNCRFAEDVLARNTAEPLLNDYFSNLYNEGVNDDDIDFWWNLHDVERKLIVQIEDFQLNVTLSTVEESGKKGNEVIREMMKIKVIYENFNHKLFIGENRPLPYELRHRINVFFNKYENDKVSQDEIEKFSSLNSFIRAKISLGEI